ncbi:beta galactosidase jelly roll domain-containing protein [bacterium]|nr:beta galactosidase jelly roll domain-containing protein [bacterium]
MRTLASLILFFSLSGMFCSHEQGLRIDLAGTWNISLLDDTSFIDPGYDAADWAETRLPGTWERDGFPGHDGFAWYRKAFSCPSGIPDTVLCLRLGRISDADEVWLNGRRIGATGGFPPWYRPAMNTRRIYRVPVNLLRTDTLNVIAVRVYNLRDQGGIASGPLALEPLNADTSLYGIPFLTDLSGAWMFHPGWRESWKEPPIGGKGWKRVTVPSPWEYQGFPDLDGAGTYRCQFLLPPADSAQTLVLALGAIDDQDETWLNGVRIGVTGVFPTDHSNRERYDNRTQNRFYLIPPHALVRDGINTLTVRVYDFGGQGGMIEGPVGIVTRDDFLAFTRGEQIRAGTSFPEPKQELLLNLAGTWEFFLEDDPALSDPEHRTPHPDTISVPGCWENSGFPGLDGIVWYRKYFTLPDIPAHAYLTVKLGRINDNDEVFINGHYFNSSGLIAPGAGSAAGLERSYPLPASLLSRGEKNCIAIRVWNSRGPGGIVEGPVGIFLDRRLSVFLKQDLSGYWKFAPGDDDARASAAFDDADWRDVVVPAFWEYQGYPELDGFGWYRTSFLTDGADPEDDLILVLGRINDFDQVWLNGEKIGETGSFTPDELTPHGTTIWQQQRLYSVPRGLIRNGSANTIAVRVFDVWRTGGIWDGPVGLTTRSALLAAGRGQRR